MSKWLLAALVFGVSTGALAQQSKPIASPTLKKENPKPELPEGPLLGTAPRFSEWLVSYTYAAEPKKDPKAPIIPRPAYLETLPSKVTTTKTDNIIHESMVDVRGRTSDTWFNGTTQYRTLPGSKVWLEAGVGIGNNVGYVPLPPSGFRELDWLNEANYAGILPYGNGYCLVFVPGGYHAIDLKEASQNPKLLEAQPRVAYIDAQSRMPVAFREGTTTRSYHFNPPPVAMQSLPADLTDAIAKGNESRRRLAQSAARPN